MRLPRNGCGFLMLAKLRQLECAQGFVHLMYNLLEMLGKVMEFMLPSGSAVYGNGQRLLPVRALSPLMRMRAYRRRWTSWDLSCTGRTRHINPAWHPSPWSPFSE
ncbi:MAG: hypothetical protein L0Z46_05875 [Nitrospiraceae bacterium]|nr:hypothetical protein [Nitrospiraceae bacterium]